MCSARVAECEIPAVFSSSAPGSVPSYKLSHIPHERELSWVMSSGRPADCGREAGAALTMQFVTCPPAPTAFLHYGMESFCCVCMATR